MPEAWRTLAETVSLCPHCLQRLPARYAVSRAEPDVVVLIKECPEHGVFRTPVWRGLPEFRSWRRRKIPSSPLRPRPATERGCPYDCGLCERHGQHTCCALLEVTERCGLACPLCFASAGGERRDPDLGELGRLMDAVYEQSGACIIQLSGGEPCERDDLPEIIGMACGKGFSFVQVNTNGLRLGTEPGYARSLAEAGLSTVYLQFDGVDDDVVEKLRGRRCLAEKRAAIRASVEAGLGVVLVVTVVPEVNVDQLGGILRLAIDEGPGVRGVHLQPVAYFGRYPEELTRGRLTLPEAMRALAGQSGGLLKVGDFHPPGCEHSLCSFSALYERTPEGGLRLLKPECCCPKPEDEPPIVAKEGARRTRAFTALHWRNQARDNPGDNGPFGQAIREFGLDRRFTISGMAFQDALSVDVERLKGCCIHVVDAGGDLVPFCAYNMTAVDGRTLHRGRAGAEAASGVSALRDTGPE